MAQKLRSMTRIVGVLSGFEGYLSRLQVLDATGAPSRDEAPVILDDYANTSSAGSIIAFHKHNSDLPAGTKGVICSFGAGYSIGSVIVNRVR